MSLNCDETFNDSFQIYTLNWMRYTIQNHNKFTNDDAYYYLNYTPLNIVVDDIINILSPDEHTPSTQYFNKRITTSRNTQKPTLNL